MNDFDNKQICSYKDIDRFGFTCDVCGRKVNGCHYINGMSFCEKCYQETFGKDNQQNEIQQLKQQLEEKDEQIKKRVMVYEKQFIEQTDEIYSLKQQLAETEQRFLEFQEDSIRNEQIYVRELAEKDKEIERLKDFIGCKGCVDVIKKSNKDQTQLAIKELEKVKNKCNGMYELWLDSNYKENMYNNEDIAGVFEDISVFTNDLIKKLKGE